MQDNQLSDAAEEISFESVAASTSAVDYITINGEQYSTSLTELRLDSYLLTNEDIKPLQHMTNLNTLSLSIDYSTDLSRAGVSRITDISPLAGLTDLVWLDLCFNSISDISQLAGLTDLTHLMLNGNQIRDISALSQLKDLSVLVLIGNQVSDITPLSETANLTELVLTHNMVSDITSLSGLDKLTFVDLLDNQVIDWIPVLHVDAVDGRP